MSHERVSEVVTDDEVTRAAMYLLAKTRGLNTRRKSVVEREWHRWHRTVHSGYREQVRKALRALKWAAETGGGSQ